MLGLRERMEENGSAPGTGEAKRSAAAPADPEVVDRPLRRRFSPSYKLRIVEEADRCTEPGEVGQLLRREGLYSSHLTTWRKAAHSGSLKALSKKRGRKPERNPLDEKVRKLERRNARLENELRKAHLIIDVQGKVAGLLGISRSCPNGDYALDTSEVGCYYDCMESLSPFFTTPSAILDSSLSSAFLTRFPKINSNASASGRVTMFFGSFRRFFLGF